MLATKRKWVALISMTAALAMIFLDQSILPVALPTIQRELGISNVGIQWVMNAYFLTSAALVIAGGKLSDLIGHRKGYCIGMFLFALGSAFGGLAFNGLWLIVARTVQGVGAAMMGPSATAIIMETFSKRERGRAIGISVGIGSLFLSIGPFLGGFLTEFVDWRWVFWINLPIAVSGICLTFFSVPRSEPVRETFDFRGFVYITLGLFGLATALTQGSDWGWTSMPSLITIFLPIFCFTVLALTEERAKHPFVDFKLFKDKVFLGSLIALFCAQFVLTNSIYWSMFFQTTLDYSPVHAGAVAIISTLPLMVFSPTAGYFSDKKGAQFPLLIGVCSVLISLVLFTFFYQVHHLALLYVGLVFFGGGVTFILTPSSTAAIGEVPASKRGMATGIYNTIRYSGGTIGIAILGTIKTDVQRYEFYRDYLKIGEASGVDFNEVWRYFSKVSKHFSGLENLSDETLRALKQAYVASSFDAFTAMSIASGVVMLIALYAVLHLLKSTRVLSK